MRLPELRHSNVDKTETRQIVIFERGGKTFGLELEKVERIIEKSSVMPVPMAPPFAEGVVFHLDRVLPVLDLLKLLNIDGGKDGTLLIVIKGVYEDFAVSSDRIHGIIPVNLLRLEQFPPEEKENPYIQGIGDSNGIEFFLIDLKDLETYRQEQV